MLRAVALLGVLVTWLVPVGYSHAGLVFEFAVGGTPTSSITIGGVGGTVPIEVYLTQTDGTTILTGEGLDFAAIRVRFDNPPGIAEVQTASQILEGPGFTSGPFTQVNGVPPSAADLDDLVDPPDATVFPAAGSDRILLGTFTFTGLALGTTNISVTDLDEGAGFNDIITGLGNPLDGQIDPGSATLTVTPEPSSIRLWLLVAGAASVVTTCRARRRRKQQGKDDGGLVATSSL